MNSNFRSQRVLFSESQISHLHCKVSSHVVNCKNHADPPPDRRSVGFPHIFWVPAVHMISNLTKHCKLALCWCINIMLPAFISSPLILSFLAPFSSHSPPHYLHHPSLPQSLLDLPTQPPPADSDTASRLYRMHHKSLQTHHQIPPLRHCICKFLG